MIFKKKFKKKREQRKKKAHACQSRFFGKQDLACGVIEDKELGASAGPFVLGCVNFWVLEQWKR
jgi:hypothetical protein